MTPNISAIVPVYNRPDVVRYAVDSVLAQTLPVLEVIVVDDGSTEDVEKEVRRNMAEKQAWRERVHYIYQKNQGQSVALNNGIARAKGEWIAVNASDDMWLPNKLEWQFRAIEKYQGQCGLCFTDAWFMNNPYMKKTTLFEFAKKNFPGEIGIVEDPVRLLLHHQPVWVQTAVMRADLLRDAGGFDPELRFSEDYDFVFRMAVVTKFCYVGIPMTLIDRKHSNERHQGASTAWQKKDFKLQMDGRRLETQLRLTEGLAPDIRKAACENMRAHYSKWTNLYLKNGDYASAREAVSTAAKYNLTPGIAFKWALAHFAPKWGRKVINMRDERDARRGYGINW